MSIKIKENQQSLLLKIYLNLMCDSTIHLLIIKQTKQFYNIN